MDKNHSHKFLVSEDTLGNTLYTTDDVNLNLTNSYIINGLGDNLLLQNCVQLELQQEPDDANVVTVGPNEEPEIETIEDGEEETLGEVASLDSDMQLDNQLMHVLDSDLEKSQHAVIKRTRQYFDLQQPLSELKTKLENAMQVDLTDYNFFLQRQQPIDESQSLADSCMPSQEHHVQIDIEIIDRHQMINIADVMKPCKDVLNEAQRTQSGKVWTPKILEKRRRALRKIQNEEVLPEQVQEDARENNVGQEPNKPQGFIHWKEDENYRNVRKSLNIPCDPEEWSAVHVRHWLQWAVRHFNMPNIKLSDWNMTGYELVHMSKDQLNKIAPNDTGGLFTVHVMLLQLTRKVAVKTENPPDSMPTRPPNSTRLSPEIKDETLEEHREDSLEEHRDGTNKVKVSKATRVQPNYVSATPHFDSNGTLSNKSGNNGQIQLWQFLLELLTTKEHITIIHWTGNGSEFKFRDPQAVAQLWGERKNKPAMNYEKMSRALRYYYDGNMMIAKVQGERFVYKFACDLRDLLGYSARELNNLVVHGNAFFDPLR